MVRLFRGGTSVPNPKFVTLPGKFRANFGFDKDTGSYMILVLFWI